MIWYLRVLVGYCSGLNMMQLLSLSFSCYELELLLDAENLSIWWHLFIRNGRVHEFACTIIFKELFRCSCKGRKRKEQAILMPTNFVLFLFPGYLAKAKADLSKNPGKAQINRPTLLRSLFTLGLLCKQFDFDSDVKSKNEVSISQSDCIFFSKNCYSAC